MRGQGRDKWWRTGIAKKGEKRKAVKGKDIDMVGPTPSNNN